MGDSKRNEVFVKFLTNKYPVHKFRNVLCIADGNFELTYLLSRIGYNVESWEPKPRRESYYDKVKHTCKITRKTFNHDSKVSKIPDIIVGMHPDEATVEIILFANKYNISFVIVPCCVKGEVRYICNVGNKYKNWINRLKQIAGNCEHEFLNISGKNAIVYREG